MNEDQGIEEVEAQIAAEELREYKTYALARWLDIYGEIIGNGGIIPPTEDYREIPVCVRRKNGWPVDVIATQFNYDYADEFVEWVAGAHRTWKTSVTATEAPKFWAV